MGTELAEYRKGTFKTIKTIYPPYETSTIPRASDITSAVAVTLGNKCGVKWTPKSSSFRYKLKFSLGSWSYTTGYITPGSTSAYTYSGYTIPKTNETLLKAISGKTAKMTVALYSYNSSSSTSIGNDSATFTVTVPSFTDNSSGISTTPTAGEISYSFSDISYKDLSAGVTATRNDILLKTKNKITINIGSGWSAGYGASISTYTIAGPGFDSSNNSGNKPSFTSNVITTAGNLSYTITVKDSRGYTNSKVINYNTDNNLYCYDYYTPSISITDAYRCAKKDDGTYEKNSDGTYIYCIYTPNFAPVAVNGENKNQCKITFKCSNANGSHLSSSLPIDLGGDMASTYSVCAIIEDVYSNPIESSAKKVYGVRVMNVSADGTGIAFGQMATGSNRFEINNDVYIKGTLLIDLIYPIGSIYMSANSTNPGELFGGTWVAWGSGRVPVGVKASDTDFATAEKTGGEKTHKLTTSEMPSHTHTIPSSGGHNHMGYYRSVVSGGGNYVTLGASTTGDVTETANKITSSEGAHTHTPNNTGGGTAHNNLQPYITCYMWKRTE